MEIDQLEEVKQLDELKKIIAFYPVCRPGYGVLSLIITQDQAVLSRRSIRYILAHLAREAAVDLVAARKKSGRITGKRHEVPLPLEPGEVLVPLRTFRPLPGSEGSLGYFSLDAIAEVTNNHKEGFFSTLQLKTGQQIDLITNAATARRQVALGRLLLNEFWQGGAYGSHGFAALANHLGEHPAAYLPLLLAELTRLQRRS